MEFKPKNREWVKNAAIVFLAVLLVLTFFSNTIMNRTLPEVATAAVTDGSIVAKVRGSGTVKANGSHDVKATQTREIRSVMVKVGQEVKTGDPLFVLGAGDSAELEAAKENLRDLQYAYQKSAINMPTFNNTAEYRAVQTAERNLDAAEKTYDDAKKTYDAMAESIKDKSDLQELEKARGDMQKAYDNLISVQRSYDDRYLDLSEKVVFWQEVVNQKLAQFSPSPIPEPTSSPDTESVTTDDSGTEAGGVVPAVNISAGHVDLLVGKAQGAYVTLSAYDPSGTLDIENMDLATAQAYLADAQRALSDFVTANTATLTNAQNVYDTAKAKYDALQKYNESIYYELVPYREALDTAEAALAAAEDAYNDALANLSYTQSSNDKTLASASIDLQQMAEKIKLAQEKVKELSGDAGDQIVANVNGTVTAIGCSAGDTVTKDTVVCTIEVPDMGHTLSFSVTNDQAQRLRVGDTATVSNYYWGKEIVATLTTIRTDPKNPQTNKELTFDLSGDVTSGSELTISVGQKSANYDVIIPNSAIRSDNNGKFVLAIQAKSSPLGNRYLAKRVSVEVLASDDNNSAVVADLGYGDYVITTSSSPVKSGDQVRMAESNG
ncbi:MAG: HlyD family efflux transporter periplasmic adaptor subunit [Candidatus Limivicinus sp.]